MLLDDSMSFAISDFFVSAIFLVLCPLMSSFPTVVESCKIAAMILNVVLFYARGETNPTAATNIVEFQQQQE